MLHFALNVQVTLSDQTQKVWVSTYSNVLYSLFIHTGQPQKLPVNNLHPLFVGYLVAVIYKVSSAKEEKKLGKQNKKQKKAACMISRGKKTKVSSSVNFLKESSKQHNVAQHLKTQTSAVEHSIKWTYACRHEWINFLSSRKIEMMMMMIQKKRGRKVAQDTWLMVALKGVMHSVERILKSHNFLVLEWSNKS